MRQAFNKLTALGIQPRPGITDDDLLHSLGGNMDSRWIGSASYARSAAKSNAASSDASPIIWHIDAECIEDNGDYVRVLERFVILTKGLLPLTNLRDSVDIENGEASG